MIDEKYIKENPCVAYLAHPYNGDHQNLVEARMLAGSLYEKYPKLTILNPLDNGEFMLGDDEENIIKHDLELLARCDVLLLAPDYEDSEGCVEEFKAAMDKGMDVMLVEVENGDEVSLCPAVYENTDPLADEIPEGKEPSWENDLEAMKESFDKNDAVDFFMGCAKEKDGKPIVVLKLNGNISKCGGDTIDAITKVAEDAIRELVSAGMETGELLKINDEKALNALVKTGVTSLLTVATQAYCRETNGED